jgi:hypothetical protein
MCVVVVTLGALAAVGMPSARSTAQAVPKNKVLLVHGHGGNGNDWAPMEALIQASIPNVETSRPNISR